MNNRVFFLLTCALFFVHPSCQADGATSSGGRFPMERLAEARRALDAARGDVAAVKAWLARGEDPDVQGDLEPIWSIGRGDVPRVFEALAGASSPAWEVGTLFSPARGRLAVLYKGKTLQETLSDLGITRFFQASFSSQEYALGRTVEISRSARLTVLPASLELSTSFGTFTFWTSPLPRSGEWVVDGSEPLSSWTVKGTAARIWNVRDAHLSLLALASPPDSDAVSLVIRGIPSFNPLACAILYQRTAVIEELLRGGASPDARRPGGGTALHLAAAWGREDEADALLRAGADIDARTDTGMTPLMTALEGPQRRTGVLRLQGDTGAQEYVMDVSDWIPPPSAAPSGQARDPVEAVAEVRTAMAEFLLENGADPSARRDDGETVLFSATRQGMLPLMARLLGAGIDIDAADANGETALFAAVRVNQAKALEFLVDHGASWNLRNAERETPKRVAAKSGAPECVGILEYREPVHWSVVPAWNVSWTEVDGYEVAWGFGASVDVHVRLSRLFWLTAEAGYTSRGTLADTTDPWLPSPLGDPFYAYRHIDLACLVDFALAQGSVFRISLLGGLGYVLQQNATISTESGLWEPADVTDQLGSSGLYLVVGMGANGFFWGGVLVGMEVRYMQTLTGEWTARGGRLGSWVMLVRVGS